MAELRRLNFLLGIFYLVAQVFSISFFSFFFFFFGGFFFFFFFFWSTFLVLVTRVILAYDLHLYLPMSLVEENMARAQQRDAVLKQKFWFRKDIAPSQQQGGRFWQACGEKMKGKGDDDEDDDECETPVDLSQYEEMTALEVLTGKEGGYFPGLLPLVYEYLEQIKVEPLVKAKVRVRSWEQ